MEQIILTAIKAIFIILGWELGGLLFKRRICNACKLNKKPKTERIYSYNYTDMKELEECRQLINMLADDYITVDNDDLFTKTIYYTHKAKEIRESWKEKRNNKI